MFEVPDKNDFATKLVLRMQYASLLLGAARSIFTPESILSDPSSQIVSINGSTPKAIRFHGVFLFYMALFVIAAAQGDYAGQKRALQYSMVGSMVYIALLFTDYSSALGGDLNDVSLSIVFSLLSIVLGCWACYFWKDPEDISIEE